MWAPVVVKADPVSDCAGCMLDAVEALAVNALLFQRPDHALDYAVLFRAVRRDKFPLQAVAADLPLIFHPAVTRVLAWFTSFGAG